MPENGRVGHPLSRPRAEPDGVGATGVALQIPDDRPPRRPSGAPEATENSGWNLVQPVMIWFHATRSMSARDIERARSLLSSEERERGDQFVFERDRRDFVAAHALLRGALSHHGGLSPDGWRFGSDASGKPYLIDRSELQFNISHTRGLVACALSLAGPIGVDVEPIDRERDIASISARNFAPTEVTDLGAVKDGARRQAMFIELWTLKEAYLKALGAGLSRPLDEIAFRFSGASDLHAAAKVGSIDVDWRFGLVAPLPDYRLAVAVHARGPFRFHALEWPGKTDRPPLAPLRSSRVTDP
jgi:4'-phosphopantetheinyl transferase